MHLGHFDAGVAQCRLHIQLLVHDCRLRTHVVISSRCFSQCCVIECHLGHVASNQGGEWMFNVPLFGRADLAELRSSLTCGPQRRPLSISGIFLGATSAEVSFFASLPSFGPDRFCLRNFHDLRESQGLRIGMPGIRLFPEKILFSNGVTVTSSVGPVHNQRELNKVFNGFLADTFLSLCGQSTQERSLLAHW